MWQDLEIVWQKTNHDWDCFGEETTIYFDDDPLYATVLTTWKKQTLGDFIRKVAGAVVSAYRLLEEQNTINALALVIAGANLFPLNLKLIKDDQQAAQFLNLLHEDDEGEQFFIRSEIENMGNLTPLIDYFIKESLLIQKGDLLIVQGKVLNRVHINRN